MAAEVDKSTVEDSSPNSPEEKRKETQKLPTVIGAAAAGIVAVAGTAHFYHSTFGESSTKAIKYEFDDEGKAAEDVEGEKERAIGVPEEEKYQ